jgi:dTDP-glucose pyrophosphorylase
MDDIALVMPMAGQGTRFQRIGVPTPKPLVELCGRPFFWWATESVLRSVGVRELVFVVLAEHVEHFGIDAKIRFHYPAARIVTIPEVTSGAAETAAIGVAALETSGPFALNDCDHAFLADGILPIVGELNGRTEGALLGFRSDAPVYSYVRFDDEGRVVGTMEKRVVSEFAIAGCYLFADAQTFAERFADYRRACPYDELFVSGIYNGILRAGGEVLFHELNNHVSFGTPDEYRRVGRADLWFLDAGAR